MSRQLSDTEKAVVQTITRGLNTKQVLFYLNILELRFQEPEPVGEWSHMKEIVKLWKNHTKYASILELS